MSAGVVVWVTGLPSAGKSTFAEAMLTELRERNAHACVLDGDAVRASLSPPLGYSAIDRAHFYETLARLAALLARQGLVVLVPATAHRRSFRARAGELAPEFIEVFVDTPREECERRDSKKLYARSRAGEEHEVPGAAAPYEASTRPAIVAHGGFDRIAQEALLAQLLRLGAVSAQAKIPA